MSDASPARSLSIAALHIYPIKSCRGIAVDQAEVEPRGFAGDRRLMFVEDSGRFLSQRTVPRLAQIDVRLGPSSVTLKHAEAGEAQFEIPDNRAQTISISVWNSESKALLCPLSSNWIEKALGTHARLVFQPEELRRRVDTTYGNDDDIVSFADGFPFLIANSATLDALNQSLSANVGMENFRPNIVLQGAEPFEEQSWRQLRMGDLTFDLVKPCTRCVVVTTNQLTGERDRSDVLKQLARVSRTKDGVVFGQNAIARAFGTLTRGDAVDVLA